jgi:hypothetical protein
MIGYEGSPCQASNPELSDGVPKVLRLEEATMFYVGLDIHDKRIAICVLGETGQVVRRAQVRSSRAVGSGRSPTVWAYFRWAERRDPQRRKILQVSRAHYLVRVMWATLKHATVWEERPTLAKDPHAI